jgi:alpha-amylase/alpha-mannosidase (GH57 family)
MTRYVCVHGHFYQPPREHPWLEVVEQQDTAYPFHDWNERITAECYAPNVRARILDHHGRISRLLNNYGHISFDVGPTLLAWMKDAAPTTYAWILEADRASAARFGGHGSAMAQPHSHAILPLGDERDRRTEIRWGITDFRHRFGRDPEGMWLPEAAVDDLTLDLLAEHGIAFTVLAPHQARRTRELGARSWETPGADGVDTTRPYRVVLPSGRSIAVFFYDGAIARAVAFERLLDSGEAFTDRLLQGFRDRPGPQLVHLATDGESYGHHHRHGEMALAAMLERLESHDDVRLTNYAQFLELHPPTHEAELVQSSSWSCAHGVERWRADCGCGGSEEIHQRWRAPLRSSLEQVRDRLEVCYEEHAAGLLREPWQARDDYYEVVLDRRGRLSHFLERHATHELDERETNQALRLLELQRHALLMFTSCGWFFEEISRLEPVQVLRYAARAVQLAATFPGYEGLEEQLLEGLAAAPGNDPDLPDGAAVYRRRVRPLVTTLEQVAAHVVIADLMSERPETSAIGAYRAVDQRVTRRRAGRSGLAHGRLTVRSEITLQQMDAEVAAVHLGDHNVVCGVHPADHAEQTADLGQRLDAAFGTVDFPEMIRTIDQHFGEHQYSLRDLFRDEQREALERVLAGVVEELEGTYRAIYRGRAPLLRFMTDVGAQVPAALHAPARVVINAQLRDRLSDIDADAEAVRGLLEEAVRIGVELDEAGLAHTLSQTVSELAEHTAEQLEEARRQSLPFETAHARVLARALRLLEVVQLVPFEVDLSLAQDAVWRTVRDHHDDLDRRAAAGDADATRWRDELRRVAFGVGVAVPELGEATTARTDRPG